MVKQLKGNARKYKRLDVWNNSHLPRHGTRDDVGSRRVARDRHGRFTQAVFVDGHSGKMNSLDITAYDWGASKEYVKDNPLPDVQ